MSPEIQEQNVSVKVNVNALKILDNIACQTDISRHKLIHDMIELTIKDLEFGRRIGFFQMIILIRNFSQKIISASGVVIETVQKEEKTIPIRLSKNYLDRLDLLVKQADRSRHYLMKKFIEVGADELDKIYNKKIPITHGLLMRKLKIKMESICDEGEKAFELYHSELE